MITLAYRNKQLTLIVNRADFADRILRSAKFKIRVRRYVESQDSDIDFHVIYFQTDITIHDMNQIIKALKDIVPTLVVEEDVLQYIEQRRYFIDKRYRVGNEIKKQSDTVQEEFKAFRQIVNQEMCRPLTEVQLWNAFYMSVMKFVSNFSVPGSGKTATVLGTYAYYKEKNISDKIVMIGPKNAFGSWIDEYKVCFGIKNDDFYLNIHDSTLSTSEKRKYALKFESGNKELILVNYESLQSLHTVLVEIIDSKTLLVFDEVHKIKNPIGQRAAVSKDVSEDAGTIIALTGTPIPNSYVDIYNVLNILYKEDYKDFFGFSVNELKNAQQREIERINKKIKPFFCRISKEDLDVPPVNEDIIYDHEVNEVEKKLFKIIYQTYKSSLFALLVRIYQLESNPELLLNNIDISDIAAVIDDESDYSEEVVIQDYSEDVIDLVKQVHITTKTKATIDLIKKLNQGNKKVIVWCIFVSSIKELERLFGAANIKVKCIYGEVALEDRLKLIDQFRNGEIDVLITNPHTLAESVSLHTV